MYTLTFDEKDELKKEDICLTEEQAIAWDYATEVDKMHVFHIDDCDAVIVFWGDTCRGDIAETYPDLECFLKHAIEGYYFFNSELMRKVREYAESKKKEYTVEFVAWALKPIRAKSAEDAIDIAKNMLWEMNHNEEYIKSFCWDSPDLRLIWETDDSGFPDKTIYEN